MLFRSYKQKGVDTFLTMDLMDMPLENPKIKTVILIASDSDFVPVIRRLKELGIDVILYTYFERDRKSKFSTSNKLLSAVTKYIKLNKQENIFFTIEPAIYNLNKRFGIRLEDTIIIENKKEEYSSIPSIFDVTHDRIKYMILKLDAERITIILPEEIYKIRNASKNNIRSRNIVNSMILLPALMGTLYELLDKEYKEM